MSFLKVLSPCCGGNLAAKIGTDVVACNRCDAEFQLVQIDNGYVKTRAKFTGNCRVCGLELPVDSIILWKRGVGVKHLLCERSPYPKLNLEDWL